MFHFLVQMAWPPKLASAESERKARLTHRTHSEPAKLPEKRPEAPSRPPPYQGTINLRYAGKWNYALEFDENSPAKSEVVTEMEFGKESFSDHHPPVRLAIKARRLDQWRIDDGASHILPQNPVRSGQPE
jgi:hypothetical protein